jgi:hypothetical protein
MEAELEALGKALDNPHPVIAIVGGSKVSTKLDLLENLVTKVDALVIGGGMANTFLHAQGVDVGKSLCEKDLAATALRILVKANSTNCAIILPVDAVVAEKFEANAPSMPGLDAIPANGMILVSARSRSSGSTPLSMMPRRWCGMARSVHSKYRRSTAARYRPRNMQRRAPRPASSCRSPAAATPLRH